MEQLAEMGEMPFKCTRSRFSGQVVDLSQPEASKAKALALFKAIGPPLAFLPLDMSWGRWSPEDVESLHEPLRRAMVAGISLLGFHFRM